MIATEVIHKPKEDEIIQIAKAIHDELKAVFDVRMKAIENEMKNVRGQLDGNWSRIEGLLKSLPTPIVNVQPRAVRKHIEYDEFGRPSTIEEKELES